MQSCKPLLTLFCLCADVPLHDIFPYQIWESDWLPQANFAPPFIWLMTYACRQRALVGQRNWTDCQGAETDWVTELLASTLWVHAHWLSLPAEPVQWVKLTLQALKEYSTQIRFEPQTLTPPWLWKVRPLGGRQQWVDRNCLILKHRVSIAFRRWSLKST